MSNPKPTRYLTHMAWPDVAALDKKEGVVILPIGAIEQHGPHLPTQTDTMIATHMVDATLAQLPDAVKAWALPTLNYGKSTEHLKFPGTISLSADTLVRVLHDIGRSISRAGFRRLAFVNGHGGNIALLDMVARDIRAETGLMCFCVHPGFYLEPPFPITPEEQRYGLHAGETETSLILAIQPDTVQMDKATKRFPDFPETDTPLFFVGKASAAWLAHDWSDNGVFGDATLGTAEKGEALIEVAITYLTKLITVISCFEVAHPNVADDAFSFTEIP
ncbi:MAG: creatininase family protein [Chloroflexota bacterium]